VARNDRTAARLVICLAAALACVTGSARAAGDYPLNLTFEASTTTAAAAVTSSVIVRVDRLMEENRRKRVTDALMYGGYANFLNALRTLPPIGTIGLMDRSVDIRYAYEQPAEAGRRLVLVADRPLFFLGGGDPGKSRAGYELTIVELRFDAHGGIAGTMVGAGRVKPSPTGVVLDDFANAAVRLSPRVARQ
jgi:hypothetical protein